MLCAVLPCRRLPVSLPLRRLATPPPLHQVLPSHIRNNLMVFVNCLVEDPTFDSQTKETLTLDNLTVEHATLPPAVVRKALTQTSLGDQILSLSK